MLTKTLATEICRTFQLGQAGEKIELITDGLLHQVWQLDAETGKFAVKILNPRLVSPDSLKQFYLGDEVARSMFNFGINTALACQGEQGIVARINQGHYMVFPWIEGVVLAPQAVEVKQAFTMGKILGEMHGANLRFPELEPPRWRGFAENHWQTLIQQGQEKNCQWPEIISQALPELMIWSELAAKVAEELNENLVVSHRDLDSKNVIWQNNKTAPVIMDWDYAGLINHGLDLLILMLNWSGQAEHHDAKLFQGAMEGYVSQKATLPTITMKTLYGFLGYAMDWLEFAMNFSLHNESEILEKEIAKTLTAMRSAFENRNELLGWIEKNN